MRSVLSSVFAGVCAVSATASPAHLDLQMTGGEYRRALETADRIGDGTRDAEADAILAAGNRLYKWIAVVNATRPPENRISLSSAATTAGIPITTPSRLKLDEVKVEFQRLADDLPDEMRSVLVEGATPPATLAIADQAFVFFARKVDLLYSRAARWQLLIPALEWYTQRKKDDVRGYYHLTRTEGLDDKLKNYTSLGADEKKQIEGWLLGLCGNSGFGESWCRERLQHDVVAKNVPGFYGTMKPYGEKTWATFWDIQNPRADVTWSSSSPNVLRTLFQKPSNDKVAAFLKTNVEDEWKWQSWSLVFDFRPGSSYPEIVFEAGATPHVNDIGGGTITMDENLPLEEYIVRWTIRHEYGHVLGFPDCYVEFYDASEGAFVNYQLDTTDLMCSRTGHMNQRLYDELRHAYYR